MQDFTVNHPTNKVNFTEVDLNGTLFYFSYSTLIAVQDRELLIRYNEWGPTTGKHLNYIDPDKAKRMSGPEFEKIVNERYGKLAFC